MKIHLSGDSVAPLAFALAGLGFLTLAQNPDPQNALPHAQALGFSYLGLSLVFLIGRFKGRSVLEGSRYFSWGDLGTSFTTVVGATLLLYFGTGFFVMSLNPFNIVGLFTGGGFLAFAQTLLFQARLTVFTPDKKILSFIGKPWSFRRSFKISDFHSLRTHSKMNYAGQLGRIQRWRRAFYIFAVNDKQSVLLSQDSSLEEIEKTLKDLHHKTGLAVKEPPKEAQTEKAPLNEKVGPLKTLLKKYPKARVLDPLPKDFSGDFMELLNADHIPHHFDLRRYDESEEWAFDFPLIVSVKELRAFEEYQTLLGKAPDKEFIVITEYYAPDWRIYRSR